jgi:hypothetical protein
MLRVHVVLLIARLSGSQLAVFAAHILLSMTGNANFITPFPTLVLLQTAINNLNAALNAQQKGNKLSTQKVKDARYQLQRLLRAMAAYVEFTSNDVVAVALSSGFSTSTHTTGSRAPLTAIHSMYSGQIDLRAKGVAGAGSYLFQFTQTPLNEASWTTATIIKQVKHSVPGLTPGVMYWFRVVAVTKDGQQPFSNAVNIMVL